MDIQVKQMGDTLWLNLSQLAEIIARATGREISKPRRYIVHKPDLEKIKILIEQFYQSHLPTAAWEERNVPFRGWWEDGPYCFTLQAFRDWWGKQIRDYWLTPAELTRSFEEIGLISHRVRFQGKGNAVRVWAAPFL